MLEKIYNDHAWCCNLLHFDLSVRLLEMKLSAPTAVFYVVYVTSKFKGKSLFNLCHNLSWGPGNFVYRRFVFPNDDWPTLLLRRALCQWPRRFQFEFQRLWNLIKLLFAWEAKVRVRRCFGHLKCKEEKNYYPLLIGQNNRLFVTTTWSQIFCWYQCLIIKWTLPLESALLLSDWM